MAVFSLGWLAREVGASWEEYAVEEVIKAVRPMRPTTGPPIRGELDLLLFKKGQRIGVECKRADAPVMTPSMRVAMQGLKLDRLVVVCPGEMKYSLAKNVGAIPLAEFVGAR